MTAWVIKRGNKYQDRYFRFGALATAESFKTKKEAAFWCDSYYKSEHAVKVDITEATP
jgi:hypothetical protein